MAELTTEQVRSGFAYLPVTSIPMSWREKEAAAFDRWLEDYGQAVKTELLREVERAIRRAKAAPQSSLTFEGGLRRAAAVVKARRLAPTSTGGDS